MKHERMPNLSSLAFESKVTETLDFSYFKYLIYITH